jgi:hypothetical protein
LSYGPSVFVSTTTWWRTTLRTYLQLWVALVLAVGGLGRVLVATRPMGEWRGWGTPHLQVAVLAAFSADAVLTGARELR